MRRFIPDGEKALTEAADRVNSRYRQKYHANVPGAWGNDPNGFIYYGNAWHLFYQCNPYEPKWDTMHWGHLSSTDLIHWKQEPIALAPDADYDKELGCFSGTSIVIDDAFYIMYTGVDKYQQQCVAMSRDGIHFEKYEGNPVITVDMLPDCASKADFRDPKVFIRDGNLYAIMCTKTNDRGNLVLFKGTDMFHWEYVGMLFDIENREASNYFLTPGPCECPDYELVDGQELLMFCPQNLPTDGMHYENIHSVVFMTGSLDFTTGHFNITSVKETDEGFDFYAPESNIGPDGRLVLIGWKEMWDRSFITARDGWVGSFTLPRVISIEKGEIIQRPVEVPRRLLTEIRDIDLLQDLELNPSTKCFELQLDICPLAQGLVTIELLKGLKNSTLITYDCDAKVLCMDRSVSGELISGAEPEVNRRYCSLCPVDGHILLDIFVDVSSVEIFMNNGEKVMTGNVYPEEKDMDIRISSDGKTRLFELKLFEIV